MSEKQGTGIPTILSELKKNGSPLPEFEMDEDRTYLIVTIKIRNGFGKRHKVSESMSELEKSRMKIVLDYLNGNDNISSATAAVLLDVHVKTASRLLKQAEEIGLLESEGKTRDKIYMIK